MFVCGRRPSGNVARDVAPHCADLSREKLAVLEKRLSDLEAQNKLLQAKVTQREKHAFRTRDKILTATQDLQQVLTVE